MRYITYYLIFHKKHAQNQNEKKATKKKGTKKKDTVRKEK